MFLLVGRRNRRNESVAVAGDRGDDRGLAAESPAPHAVPDGRMKSVVEIHERVAPEIVTELFVGDQLAGRFGAAM